MVLQLASTVIIARLLTPAEVGVFAVAAVFAGLASTFRDFGVAEYLIQERELTQDKIRAALTLNIIVSWSMALALFAAGPVAGDFYREPGVVNVMWVQALTFLLIPFGAVTQAWFRRELNYRPIVICNLLANIAAFATAVGLAYLGFGYMSLAWSGLVGIVVTVTAVAWFRPKDFPLWPSLKGVGQVFHFGKFASAIYLMEQVGKGAPELVIGRALTMADVGMFSRANGLVEMFHRLVMRPVLQVCMPYFAKSDREQGSLVAAYLHSLSLLTAVGWPFLAFLSVIAFAAIRIIYGTQWMQAVPVAQVLCVVGAVQLMYLMAREALLACGAARRANHLQMGLLSLQLLGLSLIVPLGLMGAAVGLLAAALCSAALTQWHLHRGIGLALQDVVKHCLPSLALTALAVAPVGLWAALQPIGEANYWQFALVGGTLTTGLWLAGLRLMRHALWHELTIVGARVLQAIKARRAPAA